MPSNAQRAMACYLCICVLIYNFRCLAKVQFRCMFTHIISGTGYNLDLQLPIYMYMYMYMYISICI